MQVACHSRCFAELLRAARFSNRIVRLVGAKTNQTLYTPEQLACGVGAFCD